ncbi:MAG: glycosyltransferase family 4 protein [Candidatus Lokiarchaeia archaeon]
MIIEICLSFFGLGAVMRRARQEVQALLNAGHEVTVITDLKYLKYLRSFKNFRGKLYIKPIKLLYIYRFRKISSELSFAFQIYYALKSIMKKSKIDLIIAHGTTYCYGVAPFANKYNIPATWVIHDLIKDRIATGNPYNRWETLLYKHANRYAITKIPLLIATSNYSKKLVLIEGAKPESVFIKYNPVDTNLFSPDRNVNKNIDILFIGRFSVEKGVDILIESTKLLSKKMKILLIGDGPLKNKLIKQTNEAKQDIKFAGWIAFDDLPYYIRRSKLVVTPSRSECHATVPLLAMSCAVPVVASGVAGMEDSIDDKKNGWLLVKNNAETLGELLEQIFSDENKLKTMAEEALIKAELFSEAKFNVEIVRFYEDLIKNFKKNS